MESLKFMAERCELYRPVIEKADTKSFSVARPPYWPNPQSWDKGDILRSADHIISAGKKEQENPEWTKRDVYYEVYKTSADNFIWIENAYFLALEMKKRVCVKREKESTR